MARPQESASVPNVTGRLGAMDGPGPGDRIQSLDFTVQLAGGADRVVAGTGFYLEMGSIVFMRPFAGGGNQPGVAIPLARVRSITMVVPGGNGDGGGGEGGEGPPPS